MIFNLDLSPNDLNINRDHLLTKEYLPTKLKLLGQNIPELSVAQGVGDEYDLWPTDLDINRDNLLTKDYLPTMQVWSLLDKAFMSYRVHNVKGKPTDQLTCAKQYAPPSSKGGIIKRG